MDIIIDRRRGIEGLGVIESTLSLAYIRGEQKLIVSPWAALGTDTVGLLISSLLFFSTDSTPLKIAAAAGGLWMGTALALEVRKLIVDDTRVLTESV